MIGLDALVAQVGGINDPDCRAVLEAYAKVTSIFSRSGLVSETHKARVALTVLRIADEQPPKNDQGRLDARLLAIEALRSLMHELGSRMRKGAMQ